MSALITQLSSSLRRLALVALAVVLSFGLTACDGGKSRAATLSPEDIAIIERQAEGFLAAGRGEVALVVATEKMSNILDWEDRATCVLFGDGAGAAVLYNPATRQRLLPDRQGQAVAALGNIGIQAPAPLRDLDSLGDQLLAPGTVVGVLDHYQQVALAGVALVSLLVGGIGIMNIMLASVMERKSEIGLLRAVGARETDIIRQFLVEASVIALLGALIGVLLGVALAYVIAAFAGWAVAWSLLVILVAVLVCVSIAVGFGVYPAVSAARMDPVLALQSD